MGKRKSPKAKKSTNNHKSVQKTAKRKSPKNKIGGIGELSEKYLPGNFMKNIQLRRPSQMTPPNTPVSPKIDTTYLNQKNVNLYEDLQNTIDNLNKTIEQLKDENIQLRNQLDLCYEKKQYL